ncbi:MAG: hypothetical protein HUJ22_12810 [Gracilimonas sp.]|uniref:hypothetical protein n=1 Tax=Gracilimonas sp. TaxID=1974203 RepID=UPI001984B967|nr:hypothetical protein [Gracilimonas sp.]MBD3617442.1 hypothetical protein [Gracilimonas sp.]
MTVDRIEERTRKDTGEMFPVAIIAGISFSQSENGNSRFSLREVSIPLNGMDKKTAKTYFPPGSVLNGYEIYQKETDPYEWEAPDGRVLSLTHSWDIRKVDESAEATTPAPAKSSSMEKHVFAGTSRKNDLEPAL